MMKKYMEHRESTIRNNYIFTRAQEKSHRAENGVLLLWNVDPANRSIPKHRFFLANSIGYLNVYLGMDSLGLI